MLPDHCLYPGHHRHPHPAPVLEEGRVPQRRGPGKYTMGIFKKALAAATTKAKKTQYSVFITSIPDVLSFALKIVSFVMSIATISLFLCWYTPIFKWIGMPMIPYLQLCQMPDAAVIAPATLVGCAEIALPVMTIAGQQISEMAIFFVIVLSTVQIIFFTESKCYCSLIQSINLSIISIILPPYHVWVVTF